MAHRFPGFKASLPPPSPLALPSVRNLNCLLTKKHAAHFSTPISLYSKVSREPSHACSILDDTLNPIWLKACSFSFFCICPPPPPPSINSVCNSLRAWLCMEDSISHVQICVGMVSCVGVCHVFAVISLGCWVSQDLCYAVCSACQAQLRLHSNSQHCAMVGKKWVFLCWFVVKGEKTHIDTQTATLP